MSALCRVESKERAFIGEERLSVIDAARRWLRVNGGSSLEQCFRGDPHGVTPERHHNVGLYARLFLMELWADGKLTLQSAEGSFGFARRECVGLIGRCDLVPSRTLQQSVRLPCVAQQGFDFAAQFRVVGAGLRQESRTLIGRPLLGEVIAVLDLFPAVGVHRSSVLPFYRI